MKLPVAPLGSNQPPAVLFHALNYVANLHSLLCLWESEVLRRKLCSNFLKGSMPMTQLFFRKAEHFLPNRANDGLDLLSYDPVTWSLGLCFPNAINDHLRFRSVFVMWGTH